jgi:predicted RNase H-like nuclease (RuvC/YqgF family)
MNFIPEIVLSLISLLGGYFVGQRKTNAETDRIVIENVKEILSVYTDTIDSLREEVKELKTKIFEYQTHIDKLQTELNQFRNEMKK